MPVWAQWITFAGAVIGCLVAVINLVINYVRGARNIRIGVELHPRGDEVTRLLIKVVNRGAVAVTIADICVVRGRGGKAQSYKLGVEYGQGYRGAVLEKGTALSFPIYPESLNMPLDAGANTIQITTADERIYRRRFRQLLDLKDELQCEVIEIEGKPWEGKTFVRRGADRGQPIDAASKQSDDGVLDYGD